MGRHSATVVPQRRHRRQLGVSMCAGSRCGRRSSLLAVAAGQDLHRRRHVRGDRRADARRAERAMATPRRSMLVVAAPAPRSRRRSRRSRRTLVADRVGLGERCIIPTVDVQPANETAAADRGRDEHGPPRRLDLGLAGLDAAGADHPGRRRPGCPAARRRSPGRHWCWRCRGPLRSGSGGPTPARRGPRSSPSVVDDGVDGAARPDGLDGRARAVMTVDTVLGDDRGGRRDLVAFIRAAADRAVDRRGRGARRRAAATDDGPAFADDRAGGGRVQRVEPGPAVGRGLPGREPAAARVRRSPCSTSSRPEPRRAGGGRPPARRRCGSSRPSSPRPGSRRLPRPASAAPTARPAVRSSTSAGVLPTRRPSSRWIRAPRRRARSARGGRPRSTRRSWPCSMCPARWASRSPTGGPASRWRPARPTFAISLFPATSEFGLWSFSTELDGWRRPLELVPIGSLGRPGRWRAEQPGDHQRARCGASRRTARASTTPRSPPTRPRRSRTTRTRSTLSCCSPTG